QHLVLPSFPTRRPSDLQRSALLGILAKSRAFTVTVLKAFQVFLQQRIIRIGQAVNHPLGEALALHHAVLLHVAHLLGYFNLIGRSEERTSELQSRENLV